MFKNGIDCSDSPNGQDDRPFDSQRTAVEEGPMAYFWIEDRIEATVRLAPLKFRLMIDAYPEATGNIRRKAFAEHYTDSLINQARDFLRASIPELGQHSSCHALLTIPPDTISLTKAEP